MQHSGVMPPGLIQGLRCSVGDVLLLSPVSGRRGDIAQGIVAKQFVRVNDMVLVLGLACQKVADVSSSAYIWRPSGALTYHPLADVVGRCTWARHTGSDLVVLKSGNI